MSRRSRKFVQSVSDLSDEALHCHTYGHPWEEGPVERTVPESLGLECWLVVLRCPSCGKTRRDYLEPGTYELLWRTYTDPDGFRVLEPSVRTDFRAEDVKRRTARRDKRNAQATP